MPADFSSSNPFRRGATTTPAPHDDPSISIFTINHLPYQQTNSPLEYVSFQQIDLPSESTKKVHIQSPPVSPSIPDSTSTIGDESYTISVNPLTPNAKDDDPFDSTNSNSGEEEEFPVPTQAPTNPFSRTLETMEHPGRGGAGISPTNVSGPGKASLDVEAFKRLLMTGNSGLGTAIPPPIVPAQGTHAPGDGGSSTDTSSVSRQSIFEAVQEAHTESRRTSHEISEPEDDRKVVGTDITSIPMGRKKPPPPSSRHGKLIRVELRDDPATINIQTPPTPGSITSQAYFSSSPRSVTDLNKPLPPAPARSSHDSDRESVFDREAAGKTPDPPSPSASTRRKTPPALPLARRHSQLVSESKLTRSDSGRLSPKAEEDNVSIRSVETNRSRSDSYRAPPPPPTRRPASIRGASHHHLASSTSVPSPPPKRGTSRPLSVRPPSIINFNVETISTPNKRMSMVPPPPPPHRHGRNSIDGTSPNASRRPSGETPRKSIDSVRRGSTASSLSQFEIASPNHDVLADLNALQREIDALRGNSGKENIT